MLIQGFSQVSRAEQQVLDAGRATEAGRDCCPNATPPSTHIMPRTPHQDPSGRAGQAQYSAGSHSSHPGGRREGTAWIPALTSQCVSPGAPQAHRLPAPDTAAQPQEPRPSAAVRTRFLCLAAQADLPAGDGADVPAQAPRGLSSPNQSCVVTLGCPCTEIPLPLIPGKYWGSFLGFW